ncbi:hypothetical protein GOP47_0000629 [Adiantum capillus-veneris]|uniref:Uncharacterized protein n=1 Tax=Adiantum capillus-veneris TaxID=13818 RepID=A0A9D4ZT92_ADICA|nr:hypothetical protein GOP47_0000629 [Adiantum capillus-veneris]
MRKLKERLYFPHLLVASLFLLLPSIAPTTPTCIPPSGCSVALANYIVSADDSVSTIATAFQSSVTLIENYNQISDVNSILPDQVLSIPFPCACSNGQLGYSPEHAIKSGDTIDNLVRTTFSNLSQISWVVSANGDIDANNLTPGSIISIPINCSCGNPDVSTTYGLFLTYVIQGGDTLETLSQKFGIQAELLREYNGHADFNNLVAYTDIIFAPGKDGNGVYPPYNLSAAEQTSGTNKSAIIGGSVGGAILLAVVLGLFLYWIMARKRSGSSQKEESTCLTDHYQVQPISSSFLDSGEKVMEFSYEQLARITDNFDVSKKIGSGGFGTVYYAEMNTKKVAIKKMDLRESQQFKAEVQVLARVHHTNLVELVGWCTEKSLCLVYEFVENGTLRSHLEDPQKGAAPLTWGSRVQIALDTARGLEYIHEYTVPSYIHRDIKPDNILLDNSLHAKVADFGLAKLGEITGTTKNAGTQGYLAPEYVMGGVLSPKVDVYAFGVVLMQLISAKRAIVFLDNNNRRSLPSLFEDFLKQPDAKEKLGDFVDPTLKAVVQEEDHTLNSVWKVTQLACECTNFEADTRPDMKTVVIRISSLTSSQEWVLNAFNVEAGGR